MKVGELRFRAAKGDVEIAGVDINYTGVDVDFNNKNGGLLAWVSNYHDQGDAALDKITPSDLGNESEIEMQAIRSFLGEETSSASPRRASTTPMKLRINREGSFVAHPTANSESQCGKNGARYYRYFVSVEATNDKLTKEGFVMENLWVEQYFRERYEEQGETCRSCEDMAQEAVDHFISRFKNDDELEGVNLTRVLVRIHGSDVSFIEAEWVNSAV